MKRPPIEGLEKDHTPKLAYNSMVVCPYAWNDLLAYVHYFEEAAKKALHLDQDTMQKGLEELAAIVVQIPNK